MIYKVYSIRDNRIGCYMNPFYQVNDSVCKRTLANMLTEPDSAMARNPGDYDVYTFGEYDDAKGRFTLLDEKECVFTIRSLVIEIESERRKMQALIEHAASKEKQEDE